jgi:hypothetical protein
MFRILALVTLAALAAHPALAEGFQRPIPAVQSADAELWYALACAAFALSLLAVHWLVSRR